MLFVSLLDSARNGELLLVQDGFCRWHKRRDSIVVIREILVLPFRQRAGLGRDLVQQVKEKYPGCLIRAKCPQDYEANLFWKAIGFALKGQDKRCNVWECQN